MRRIPSLSRCICAGALVLDARALHAGRSIRPDDRYLQSDMFDSKKKIAGDREPVFPGGVPGTSTGVPPDLVKGYQPPPDQTAADGDAAPDAAAAAGRKAETETKGGARGTAGAKSGRQTSARSSGGLSADPDQRWKARGTSQQGAASPWPAHRRKPPQRSKPQRLAASVAIGLAGAAADGAANSRSSQSVWPNPPAPGQLPSRLAAAHFRFPPPDF